MLGIILAGGEATRLRPATTAVSKQLLPVYDKPMIYYPLSLLVEGGITNFLIITNPTNIVAFDKLLGDGNRFGVSIKYAAQYQARGLADALIIAGQYYQRSWLEGRRICLALGDNLFFGGGSIPETIHHFRSTPESSCGLFMVEVAHPEAYGVLYRPSDNPQRYRIIEKPKELHSNWAVSGLYLYDDTAVERARELQPSERNQLEITDLHNAYLADPAACVEGHFLQDPAVWFDCGTPEYLLEAAQFVRAYQHRTGKLLGSPELAALDSGTVHETDITMRFYANMPDSYGQRVRAAIDYPPADHVGGSDLAHRQLTSGPLGLGDGDLEAMRLEDALLLEKTPAPN